MDRLNSQACTYGVMHMMFVLHILFGFVISTTVYPWSSLVEGGEGLYLPKW